MSGKYTKADFERDLKARQEQKAKEEQERREAVEKETARQAWVRDGGNVRDFEREWPSLRDETRRRRVAEADARARDAHRATGVSRI